MTYDIIIVGAGPAGLSFARSLAHCDLKIAIIEKQSAEQLAAPEFDGREIALTHLSVRILKELGVWAKFAPEDRPEIKEAKVLDGTSPYCLTFDREKDPSTVLGYIVSNHTIRKALFDEVQAQDNVEFLTERAVTSIATTHTSASATLSDGSILESRLVVAADSRFSETRRMVGIPASMHDFGRVCIVCRMNHEKPHDGTAFECFHYGRTLAVLPLHGNRSSIVITAPMDQRELIMDMGEEQFNRDIEQRFESRLGSMSLVGERFAYPLVGVHARRFFANRFALIGDAAVGMHPVTAHGFNLGLSGAKILAKEVIGASQKGKDIGAMDVLNRYQTQHMRTTGPMYFGTNKIVKLFTDDRAPTKFIRQAALRVVNNFPPIKWAIQNKLTETRLSGRILPSFLRSR